MAEMRKNFTQKVGYQDALDFDPVNGIIKFGSYEMFAKDLGIQPARQEFTFQDYLKAARPQVAAFGAQAIAPMSAAEEKRLRAQFESDLQAGNVRMAAPQTGMWSAAMAGVNAASKPRLEIVNYQDQPIGSIGSDFWREGLAPKRPANEVRNISRLGPDSFAVDTYVIPNDQDKGYELLNQISARAGGVRQVRRDDALLRQNRQDSALRRQGSGSTVLGGANSAAGAAARAINS